MLYITLNNRSTKTTGNVTLRFRVRDGRGVQLFHASDIVASKRELSRFGVDGKVKRNTKIYNRDLEKQIEEELAVIEKAYNNMVSSGKDLTTAVLERTIEEIKHPIEEVRASSESLVSRFKRYSEEALRDGIVGKTRYDHFITLAGKLDRYLKINGLSRMVPSEVTPDMLMDFRKFALEEYMYVNKYRSLYKDLNRFNKPTKPLSINTAATQMKSLQTFFNVLEQNDEIVKSPFRRLSRDRKHAAMRTMYDDPIYLRAEEFEKVRTTPLPPKLAAVRDVFAVQCALGCRVGDFQKMTMENMGISQEGIPYVHYLPSKTADAMGFNKEVQTPLVRFAFDIIVREAFHFPILKNLYGNGGYNENIRAILQICEIDRKVPTFNETEHKNEYVELYKLGGSKLCRKTHVDIVNKVQIDMYAAGLHQEGSSAVRRYTCFELADSFKLLNLAFKQEPFFVDELFNYK